MSYANMDNQVKAYAQVSTQAGLEDASPHKIIQMLMQGALEKIAIAKGECLHERFGAFGSHISWAMSIIEGLRLSLDRTIDSDLVERLDSLYEYMGQKLLQANIEKDVKYLDEVTTLLLEIKSGWDAIAEQAQAVEEQRDALYEQHSKKDNT
jgi:flagellar secretion chaperone FliS